MDTLKKIGIWGLGVAGKSLVRFFDTQNIPVEVFDQRTLSGEEQHFLTEHNATLVHDKSDFFNQNTHIVPSAGIDISPYLNSGPQFIAELDLFAHYWKKPIIAVTGSIGKTSVTHLLNNILTACNIPVATGGNIGIGMLDLLQQQNTASYALLEVSSFQLEHTKSFAPDLAIWTNLLPNHLDRHGSMDNYFLAKNKIFQHQSTSQNTLLSLALLPYLNIHGRPAKPLSFFSMQPADQSELDCLQPHDILFFVKEEKLFKKTHNTIHELLNITQLPPLTFTANWVVIAAALDILGIPLHQLITIAPSLTIPEHRMEHVATINHVMFYNDSKSTTITSTLAAVAQCSGRPTHLFLGGLSKGINREPLIAQLPEHITTIYCFGKEAEQLHAYCTAHNKKSACYTTLDAAFAACINNLHPHETVLFSPSGSSFDLFNNYQERGNYFKTLVHKLKAK